MFSKQLICCAVLMAFSVSGLAAKKVVHKAPAKEAGPKRLTGKKETLACRLGTEDRHARIAVVLIGGKTDSFAYYSKWKPRTCSIYLERYRDSFSTWSDNGDITTVGLERGGFLIEHKKNEYHFVFRGIDRERYCGMEGQINGGLTIRKGSDQCQLDGDIMVEGTPLGEAFANRDEDKPPPGLMPASVPASSTPPEGASAPSTPDTAVTAVAKPATPIQQTTATSSPQKAAPTQTAAPTQQNVAPTPQTVTSAPQTATPIQQTSTSAPPNTATPAAPAPSKAKTAASVAQPPAATTTATATAKAPEQRTADAAPSNPFTSFFRSLSQTRAPETTPGPGE